MKDIKEIVEYIRKELDRSEEYARSAVHAREKNRSLCDTYANNARQALDTVNMLHEQGVRLIREYPNQPPAPMQAVWEWEHERMIDSMSKIRSLLDLAQ